MVSCSVAIEIFVQKIAFAMIYYFLFPLLFLRLILKNLNLFFLDGCGVPVGCKVELCVICVHVLADDFPFPLLGVVGGVTGTVDVSESLLSD